MKKIRFFAVLAFGMLASLFVSGCATQHALQRTNDKVAKIENRLEEVNKDLTGKLTTLTDNVSVMHSAQERAVAEQKQTADALAQKLDGLTKKLSPQRPLQPQKAAGNRPSVTGMIVTPHSAASRREENWQGKIYSPGDESEEILMTDIKSGNVKIVNEAEMEVINLIAVPGKPDRISKQIVSPKGTARPYSDARAIKVRSDKGEVQVWTKK